MLPEFVDGLRSKVASFIEPEKEPEEDGETISRREFGKLLGAGSAVGAGTLLFSDAAEAATRINTSSIDLDGGSLNNVGTVSGIDASDLSGSSGTSGQVLKTDGSSASWGNVGGNNIDPETVGAFLRGAIRDKIRDLSDGDTPISFRKSWIETLSTSSGDDNSIDTGLTTAYYTSSSYQNNQNYRTTIDSFGDGNLGSQWNVSQIQKSTNTRVSQTSGYINTDQHDESSGNLRARIDAGVSNDDAGDVLIEYEMVWDDPGLTTGFKKLLFDITEGSFTGNVESINDSTNNSLHNDFIFELIDKSDSSKIKLLDISFSETPDNVDKSIQTGQWQIKEQPDGSYDFIRPDGSVKKTFSDLPNDFKIRIYQFIDLYTNSNYYLSADSKFKIGNIEADENVFQKSEVVTNTLVSTTNNIKKVYTDNIYTLNDDSNIDVDVSVDGGANFDVTGKSLNELIDTSNVANPGSSLVLRYNIYPDSQNTEKAVLEDFAVKAWD